MIFLKKKKRKATRITSLIGQGSEITGDIHFSGCIQVDGSLHGNIRSDNDGSSVLLLSELGSIKGEVKAPYLVINGAIQGNVYGYEHVELATNACIAGNVYYALISIANGAEVNGQLVHGVDESVQSTAKDTTEKDAQPVLSDEPYVNH